MHVSTDHDEIGHRLDAIIATDAVRHTLLGTIRLGLGSTAWGAWTSQGVAARSGTEWPVAIAGAWSPDDRAGLAAALAEVPGLRGVAGEPALADDVAGRLGRSVEHVDDQRLYRCDDLVAPVVPGAWLTAGELHVPLAREWFVAFAAEAHAVERDVTPLADAAVAARLLLLWVDADGTPVSMAARRPVVSGSARIGPVYTPPALRGHGYASAVTATATRSILDESAVPVLFTDLTNPTSNRIYQALGYRPVEDRRVLVYGTDG